MSRVPSMRMVYVAGYGRSGSTLLERILALDPRMAGLGELSEFQPLLEDRTIPCSCGELHDACPLWGPVRSRFRSSMPAPLDDLVAIQRRVEAAVPWRGLGNWGPADARDREIYALTQGRILELLAEALPGATTFVDSSKTAWASVGRPSALRRIGVDVAILHLVRDVRGVLWSMIGRGLDRDLQRAHDRPGRWPGARAMLGWLHANRVAERLARKIPPRRYHRIRYEDLVADPEATVSAVSAGLDLGLDVSLPGRLAEGPSAVSHQFRGNRMRLQRPFQIEADLAWKTDLPRRYDLLARLGAGRGLRRYGYLDGT